MKGFNYRTFTDLLLHPVASYGTWYLKLCVGPLCYTPKVNFKTSLALPYDSLLPCNIFFGHLGSTQPRTWHYSLPISNPHVVTVARDWGASWVVWTFWLVWYKLGCTFSRQQALFCQQQNKCVNLNVCSDKQGWSMNKCGAVVGVHA